MAKLPTGTVTFLFTDIEGSTRLVQLLGDRYPSVLDEHRRLLRAAFHGFRGQEIETQGDSFFIAFDRATDAIEAAAAGQRALAEHSWPEGTVVRVRMGLHTGEPDFVRGRYVGLPVNRAMRLCAAAHGGQVVLSQTTRDLVEQDLPPDLSLRDLGRHQLKDLQARDHVSQLVVADLPSDFPALRSLDSRPNNLPALTTPLIGREREVAAASQRLLADDVRLLTLTGAGGIGKTRLGLQVAAELVGHYEHGVFLVQLGGITDSLLVGLKMAEILGVRESAGRPLLETLRDYLRDKHMLLLLDNFEQVLDAAPLVAELLAACPRLKVLATSRAVLHLYGEYDFPVPPLMLPEREPLPPLEQFMQSEAVRLFVERGQAVRPDFALTRENAPAVAEICHRLDGLPLAIELAAAQVRLLSPHAMLARLERRLALLTGGARDLPARQQTLRDTIAWSYDLLDESEQSLFERLGVFVGGCTLEAAETVCTAGDSPRPHVLDGIASLLDKSLIQQEETRRGDPRFRMLETVREYALERLQASGEAETILRQHAAFFLALAEQAEPELLGPRQAAWFDRLDYEYQNLRAALTWSLDRQETEIGLRLGGALWRFWAIRGHLREARHWLAALLSLAPMRTSTRGKALNSAGYLALWQGDYPTARVLHEESLAIGRELDDAQIIAWSLNNLGLVARFAGEYTRARALFEEALEICRRLGNPTLEAFFLNHLARVGYYESRYPTARAQHEESLAMRRECGDQWGIAHSLSDLADVALAQGEYQTARKSLMESLSIFQELGDRQTAVHCLEGFAAVAAAHSQPERAVRLLGAVAAVRDAMGGPGSPARRANLERILVGAHHSLSAEAYAAAWAAGRAMPLDEAVDYTLATEHDLAGATASAGKSTVSGQAAVLTPREQEVAELIARGLTNRQIAAELIVAERTVDAHVYNMLSKLGFRSRAQVAGWAVGQGLLKGSLEKI